MRLSKIIIAGFKSFADSVTIKLQSNLTGIVGPNGCGKSNIIDAVRWVMGEISAKQLRGESMSDVIFNGSTSRKPVGHASIELIFDNSDGSLGGEYAKYQEISVRREVDRDGFSDYFLNGTHCRRKDVTGIFFGTGLGPNSYAIIEQGMISELIDAGDLRTYIEDVAGVSKYKDRRKETETRIKHTRENLSRLNDIREELEKQLKHLKSQANAASRYKKLKAAERQTKAELYVLHWKELSDKLEGQNSSIIAAETALENKSVLQHTTEAKIAELRELLHTQTEDFNSAQGCYYQIGGNIGRLEQQIQHIRDRKAELARDLAQIDQVWQETIAHQESDQSQIAKLNSEQIELESGLTQTASLVEIASVELTKAEAELRFWQQSWDEFNSGAAQISQRLEVEQTRIDHLAERVKHETEALEKLRTELAGLDFRQSNAGLDDLTHAYNTLKEQYDALHDELSTKQQKIASEREISSKLATDLDALRNKLQSLSGRYSSLEALQQAALGKNDLQLVDWLKQHNLSEHARLAQGVKAESGWETAVETVLGMYLEAIGVEDFSSTIAAIEKLTHGNLALFDLRTTTNVATNQQLIPLMSKVNSTWPIQSLLGGVYIAENLAAALAMRSSLAQHESIITRDGIWVGATWARVARDANQKHGILQRESELVEIGQVITETQTACSQKEHELQNEQLALLELESEYQTQQQALRDLTQNYSDIQSQLSAKQTELEHLQKRTEVINSDQVLHTELLNIAQAELIAAKDAWQIAASKKDVDKDQRDILANRRIELETLVSESRSKLAESKQQLDNQEMRLKLIKTQQEYLQQNLERATQRLVGLKEHKEGLKRSLEEIALPIPEIEQQLQNELTARIAAETALTAAKQKVNETEHALDELEKSRSAIQDEIDTSRQNLETLRTERQGLQVRANTYQEQIKELEFVSEELLTNLPSEATLPIWEEKLSHFATRIERLGPINLAAIAEFAEVEERKKYLDAQDQDLVSALNTLENAIRKIDQDTKAHFKNTFDELNTRFQELFPKVFGGGKAYLELTSDDLLEASVIIFAQPPGKRNSTIHLLSGGEKALTAISLTFAIFQMNPAPFCMLDEVDAPLDDINVSRFCSLLQEMSKTIQFIYITHNKLTMETAEQLAGITMQEPGVSRIVDVDIAEAIKMAS